MKFDFLIKPFCKLVIKVQNKNLQDKSSSEISKLIQEPQTKEVGFRYIVSQYKERLYWLIRRMVIHHVDAEDVMQNTFIKIWQNLEKFRGDADLYTWLYRIAVNESLAFLNKKKKQQFNLNDYGDVLSEQLESDSFFDGSEAQKLLQKAILTLPDQQRLVFNMRYFEEMKYQDMARILDRSEGALKANYHHAVKKVEDFCKQY